MATQTITMQVTGAIVCGVGGPNMQAGDSVRLYLDRTDYPTLPEYINGVVQQPVTEIKVIDPGTGDPVCGTQYIIDYDDSQLNGIVPSLDPCDVLSLECTTCCQVIEDRIDTTIDPAIVDNAAAAAAAQAAADAAQATADQAVIDAATAQAAADNAQGDATQALADAAAAQATADQAVLAAAAAQAAADAAQATADANSLSVVTTSVNPEGIMEVTHDDGKGNTKTWWALQDGSPLSGIRRGTLHSVAQADQLIPDTTTALVLDTNSLQAGILSRAGNVITVAENSIVDLTLQVQATQVTAGDILTIWAELDGVPVPNGAAQIAASTVGERLVGSLDFTLAASAGSEITLFAICDNPTGVTLDYIAPAGDAPAVPAVSVSLKAFKP